MCSESHDANGVPKMMPTRIWPSRPDEIRLNGYATICRHSRKADSGRSVERGGSWYGRLFIATLLGCVVLAQEMVISKIGAGPRSAANKSPKGKVHNRFSDPQSTF